MRQVSQAQPVIKPRAIVEKHEQVRARETIHDEYVKKAIQDYIAVHKPDPTITLALTTHLPLVDGEKITLLVDNQLQLDKLEAIKVHLQTVFMKSLNNGFITMEFKLFDTNTTKEEKKLFTSSEKFEHFVKLNPVVAELKNIFGLELD